MSMPYYFNKLGYVARTVDVYFSECVGQSQYIYTISCSVLFRLTFI